VRALTSGHLDMLRALFCDEFDLDGIDASTFAAIHAGEVAEWVQEVGSTGLFSRSELTVIEETWTADPSSLVSVLLDTVDEIGAKRHELAAPAELVAVAPGPELQVAG
jgi:hypothetical protein